MTSDVVTVDVPSSAPPQLPDLQYVVPTMGWSAGEEDGGYVSRRRGGGLRIWMGRGWWSSGAGELLGVVVGSDVISPKGTDYPYVSLIGQDLIRSSASLRNLRAASFGENPVVATGVPLVGTPVPFVTVVGHVPQYDETTERWFADIHLDTGDAYAPFVRLSLVRYQPHSLDRLRHLAGRARRHRATAAGPHRDGDRGPGRPGRADRHGRRAELHRGARSRSGRRHGRQRAARGHGVGAAGRPVRGR